MSNLCYQAWFFATQEKHRTVVGQSHDFRSRCYQTHFLVGYSQRAKNSSKMVTYLIQQFLSSDWLKERAWFCLCPLKWLCLGHSQSELSACCVPHCKIILTHALMFLQGNFVPFIRFIKQIVSDCFLFGAHFKIIGPRWCQNHDYALSFTSGIVMLLASPWAYNFKLCPS